MIAKFTRSNSYFSIPVWSWNLPSGWTCPQARECKAKADRLTGEVTNGPDQRFRCYMMGVERFPGVRKCLWTNFNLIRDKDEATMAVILHALLPAGATHVRIHAGGDFFSQAYFDAWLKVCARNPQVVFWAFTKSVGMWVARLGRIPHNLTLQASLGGHQDHLVRKHRLKFAKVVMSVAEARALGLEIDTDDTLAMTGTKSFALLYNLTKPDGDEVW